MDAGTYYVKVENLNANEPSIDYSFTVSAEPVDPNILTETGKNINEKNAMDFSMMKAVSVIRLITIKLLFLKKELYKFD